MFGLEFSHAALLGLLALCVPLTALLWYASVRSTRNARQAYSEARLDGLRQRFSRRSHLPSLVAWCAVSALLVVAAAGPQASRAPQHARAGSLQVVVAFDVSKSVGAEDYKGSIPKEYLDKYFGAHGSRLDKAKQVVQSQIMPAVQGNQIGFVTYKGDGFAQADLTDDYAALTWVLQNWVRIGNAPGGGSDYARGLLEAVAMFNRAPHDPHAQRVIVLFSDGGFTGDQALLRKALDQLHKDHIRLVVLGLGVSHNARVPLYSDYDGSFIGWAQVDGQDARSSIDEGTLKRLASDAGGEYHHVTAGGVGGINWPSALGGRDKVTDQMQNVYQYPLGAAFFIIVLLAASGVQRQGGVRKLQAHPGPYRRRRRKGGREDG
jgi:Ca-activated chloride channel family protein